jgi:NADPH-dependent ferric siderophore reductase
MLQYQEAEMWSRNSDKILKYEHLTAEIQRMWNVNTKVISVITGESSAISKSVRKYLSNTPGIH